MIQASHIVVGGGLAGSATALHLARLGCDVVLLERGTFPREKVCGEGLMPHGVRSLEQLGLLDGVMATAPQPFRGIGYHVGNTRAEGFFPHGREGLGIRRSKVDEVLHHACLASPRIDVQTGVRVRDIHLERDGVRLETSGGPVAGQVVVGADGLQSLVRRKAGLIRKHRGRARYGVRLHMKMADASAQSDCVEVFLGKSLEWYITPTGPGECNVAMLCGKAVTKRFGGNLHASFMEMAMAEPRLARWMAGASPLTETRLCGPLRQEVSSAATERVLLVGDAAGFVDAITGEGMSIALTEARLAAELLAQPSIIADPSRRALRRYDIQRRRATRSLVWFTRLVLLGLRNPALAGYGIRNLARHPEAFSRLLGINTGDRQLWRVPPRDVVRLVTGV